MISPTESKHQAQISHLYHAAPENIFGLLQNGTFFKLTGADSVESDFKTGGSFTFEFNGRGTIYGSFEEIIPNNKIRMNWNVKGFGRSGETDTKVCITLLMQGQTMVTIDHAGIKYDEAARAKEKAWKEILDDLEVLLLKSNER